VWLVLGVAALGLALVAVGGAGGARAAFPDDNGLIAFTSFRAGGAQIYTMAPDGSGAVRLTTNGADNREPAWSSDGTRIAFQSNRDGKADIYTLAIDRPDVVRLTTDAKDDFDAARSPDGTRIAFRASVTMSSAATSTRWPRTGRMS
jgi:TolB protein